MDVSITIGASIPHISAHLQEWGTKAKDKNKTCMRSQLKTLLEKADTVICTVKKSMKLNIP